MREAIVLLSGGLDSATVAAIARSRGFSLRALTFEYGQRHHVELQAARRMAAHFAITDHRIVHIDLGAFGGSALTDESLQVPKDRSAGAMAEPGDVPITYVPARNTIFLSYALAWAEVTGIKHIFLGVNVLDASGYPDCRPEFVAAFQALANVATRLAHYELHAPLISLTKAEIIRQGLALRVPYEATHSCYDPREDLACGRCDACQLRHKGFSEAGVADPTRYFNASDQLPKE